MSARLVSFLLLHIPRKQSETTHAGKVGLVTGHSIEAPVESSSTGGVSGSLNQETVGFETREAFLHPVQEGDDFLGCRYKVFNRIFTGTVLHR